jgi:hypothetical protein
MNRVYTLVTCLLLLLMQPGCASSRKIIELDSLLPKKQAKFKKYKTVKSTLDHYFTKEAYRAIKGIPLIKGPAINGYVAGVNFWSNLVSFLSLNGTGRKVIIPEEMLANQGLPSIVHEYVHHLDDMDRDGEGDWIDHDEFLKAYKLMSIDMKWKGIALWSERLANSWITNTFGIGPMSEQIAYISQNIARGIGPDYMKHVYRKMLKTRYAKTVYVVTIYGKKITLHLED